MRNSDLLIFSPSEGSFIGELPSLAGKSFLFAQTKTLRISSRNKKGRYTSLLTTVMKNATSITERMANLKFNKMLAKTPTISRADQPHQEY